ncbi:MAG TPA: hypothetical protein PKB11_00045 [Desulfovibrio sp.]|uniref:hypothetical protein n=1 Tax=Desulfovibrio sp. TaxID=885 RepID=UPI002CE49F3C|nr:hypothetical protein [Desulfovibrio sp.]HMM37127.1 hypothetical protein [Desulfovibrio sp.]
MRYGCLLQAVIMMLLTLAAMGLYEYGFIVSAGILGGIAAAVMAWGIWAVNRRSGKD